MVLVLCFFLFMFLFVIVDTESVYMFVYSLCCVVVLLCVSMGWCVLLVVVFELVWGVWLFGLLLWCVCCCVFFV